MGLSPTKVEYFSRQYKMHFLRRFLTVPSAEQPSHFESLLSACPPPSDLLGQSSVGFDSEHTRVPPVGKALCQLLQGAERALNTFCPSLKSCSGENRSFDGRWNTSVFFFFKFLWLFNYSCIPFLPIPPPHPSRTHLPPPPPPSPLILSMCPL